MEKYALAITVSSHTLIMKYLTRKEAEEKFMKEFGRGGFGATDIYPKVENFINELELSRLSALTEHLKEILELQKHAPLDEANRGYNQAIDDQITYLEELKKTLQ